jgi:CRP/FNR family transcriptional regulator, cyclic AMP receptor protein
VDPNRLKRLPLFSDASDEELRQITTFCDEVSVEEGRHLVDQGDYSYEFMAVEEGNADVLRDGEAIGELGPGDFFGEIGLLEKDRRTATVVAKTPMRLITLSGWDLRRMEKTVPEAVERIRDTLAERRPQ